MCLALLYFILDFVHNAIIYELRPLSISLILLPKSPHKFHMHFIRNVNFIQHFYFFFFTCVLLTLSHYIFTFLFYPFNLLHRFFSTILQISSRTTHLASCFTFNYIKHAKLIAFTHFLRINKHQWLRVFLLEIIDNSLFYYRFALRSGNKLKEAKGISRSFH